MNTEKIQNIKEFLYAAILTEEFFDVLYDALDQEIDLENDEISELLEEHESKFENSVLEKMIKFMDENFDEKEIANLMEEDETTLTKFDSINDGLFEIIEEETGIFIEGLLAEISACTDKSDCCCN